MTYTAVLTFEFSPAVFERLSELNFPVIRNVNWHIPLKVIRTIQIPLVITGIVLSTLHQSSSGSMLLLMTETLHALWYSPILPLLFLTSAIAVGPAMVIFESTLSTRIFGHKLDIGVLSGLGRVLPYILGIYLLMKLLDLMVAGEIGLLFTAYPINLLWWGEIIIGVILPILLLSMLSVRQSQSWVFRSAILVVAGLIFNRFNVSLLALSIRPGFTYFPHWMEFAISIGLVGDALLVIWLSYQFLRMAEHEEVTMKIV